MSAQLMPDTLQRSDTVSVILLVCYLLFVLVVCLNRHSLREQMSEFLFPSSGHNQAPVATENARAELVQGLASIISSALVALLFYSYAQTRWNLQLTSLSPALLLGLYAGVCFAFLVLKQGLYCVVHSIFFSAGQRRLWLSGYRFLFTLESLLLFPLALVAVYFRISPLNALYGLAILLLFVKILALVKSFESFFDKIHGILHLFVYFCALEAVPLVVLWTTLVYSTNYLTTNY